MINAAFVASVLEVCEIPRCTPRMMLGSGEVGQEQTSLVLHGAVHQILQIRPQLVFRISIQLDFSALDDLEKKAYPK